MKTLFKISLFVLLLVETARATVLQELAKALDIPVSKLGECVEESHLSAMDVIKLETIYSDGQLPGDGKDGFLMNFGCFISCSLYKSNIMKEGKIVADKLVETAERINLSMSEDTKRKLNECVTRADEQEDKCKMGLILSVCLWQQFKH